MEAAIPQNLNLTALDATGQRRFDVRNFRPDATIGELIAKLVGEMRFGGGTPPPQPQAYHAFLNREGRHLRSAEIAGDVLEEGDEIRLQPDIQAGR